MYLPKHFEQTDRVQLAALNTFAQEHLSGVRNWTYVLWAVLMLEAWRRRHAS